MKRALVALLLLAPVMLWAQVFQRGGETITVEKIWSRSSLRTVAIDEQKRIYIGGGLTFPAPRIRVSVDSGKTWLPPDYGPYGGYDPYGDVWSFAFVDSGYVLAGTDHGIYRSKDQGLSWQLAFRDSNYPSREYLSLLVSNKTKTIFAGADEAIFRSTDNGNTWAICADSTFIYPYVWSMTQTEDGTIFAGTESGMPNTARGVVRSTDNGNSWEFVNNFPYHVGKNVPLVVAGLSPQEVYCSPDGYGAFVSYDNGNSWKHIDEIPNYTGTAGYASKSLGVFLGFYWPDKQGYTLYQYYDSQWLPVPGVIGAIWGIAQWSDNKILVATSEGLYRVGFSEIVAVNEFPVVSSFQLFQNYPNPFNPTTTIEFQIPERVFVKLSIFNTLGQEMETLVNEEKGAGVHRIVWNASSYPSGIYFYRLETSKFVETKKMILMK